MPSPSSIVHPQRRRGGRRRGGWLPFTTLTAVVLLAATVTMAPTAVRHVADAADTYHDGVFSQAAPRFCTSTDVFTPSNRIRTKIVRHSDGWSNTISSRYRKWVHCTARQMTSTMWCTTKLVDGFSGICVTPQPRAAGISPCADPALDVRSVYFPHTGRLAVTCVNRASPAGSTVTRSDSRGDASPARLDILGTRVTFNDRITVRTHFRAVERGTGYLVFVDPGRRGGALFRLEVRVRPDLTTIGRLGHHAAASPAGHFTLVGCAGLRTSVNYAADNLRVSAPDSCLRRFSALGPAMWVALNSFALPISPAGGELLPNDPTQAFRVSRG
jgi:hypothetical protein